jgi:Mn-containing catalase
MRASNGIVLTTSRAAFQSMAASATLPGPTAKTAADLMERTRSRTEHNPTTGADLGAGPGAGRMTDEDLRGAPDMAQATRLAHAEPL